MPVGEVADLEAAVVAIERQLAAARVMHLAALDGEDAVRHAGRGEQGGLGVVHGDVDAEVVAARRGDRRMLRGARAGACSGAAGQPV